ncbi:PIN domain-containing protein, partial [Vibrio vulnificus]
GVRMLETRNVFIDTQYFVKSNYNFESISFLSLKELCQKEELRYLMTSVVEREVENKIELSIKEALGSLQSFKRKAHILSTIDDPSLSSLFADVREEDVYGKANEVFHSFNTECKYEYVEADQIDPEKLLELYFEKKAPFGDGKKKSEFPDAISLLSLETYLEESEKLYVISDDKDLKAYCEGNERLIAVDSLEKLLDIYNLHTNARTEKVKQFIESKTDEIKAQVSDYISGSDVYNSSSWEDAEVDSFSVSEVGDFEINVVHVSDEECQLALDLTIELDVTVIGPDFSNGVYDKEDGHFYSFGSTTREEVIPFDFICELNLSYEFVGGELEDVEIVDLYIPKAHSIEVNVEEHDQSEWY